MNLDMPLSSNNWCRKGGGVVGWIFLLECRFMWGRDILPTHVMLGHWGDDESATGKVLLSKHSLNYCLRSTNKVHNIISS